VSKIVQIEVVPECQISGGLAALDQDGNIWFLPFLSMTMKIAAWERLPLPEPGAIAKKPIGTPDPPKPPPPPRTPPPPPVRTYVERSRELYGPRESLGLPAHEDDHG
jgi:hypothetical protein